MNGGKDPGAVDPKDKEMDDEIYEDELYTEESGIVLTASRIFSMVARYRGHEVIETRTTDEYVALGERTRIANEAGADFFVSFHANAATTENAHGIETLYHPDSVEGPKIARFVQNRLIQVSAGKDRGIKSRPDLWVLRKTQMPAILVELGFITNIAEERMLNEQWYLGFLANAVLRGLEDYTIRR